MNRRAGAAFVAMVLLVPAAAQAERTIKLEGSKLPVTLPDDWQVTSTGSVDELRDGEGHLLGSLGLVAMPCAELLANARARITAPSTLVTEAVAAPDGWTVVVSERPGFLSTDAPLRTATFCREVVMGDKPNATAVQGPYPAVTALVAVVDRGVTQLLAARAASITSAEPAVTPPPPPEAPPPPLTVYERFGPTEYDLSLFLPRAATPQYDCTPCLGGAVTIARTPWHAPSPLAWSYRGRLAGASGADSNTLLEAGLGLVKAPAPYAPWGIAVQAVAGFSSGYAAPNATYAGVDADIQFLSRSKYDAVGLGFEVGYNRAWRDGGTTTGFHIAFIGAGRQRALTAGFGWERLLEADAITLDFGLQRLPRL